MAKAEPKGGIPVREMMRYERSVKVRVPGTHDRRYRSHLAVRNRWARHFQFSETKIRDHS